jgi:thioredoxin 1
MIKLIYFTASWCGPCRTFGPLLTREAEAAEMAVQRVDLADDLDELARTHRVTSVPTVIVVRDGEPVDRFGALSASALRSRLAGIA